MAVEVCCSVKLSPNKKSIFGMIPGSQILYLLLIAGTFAAVSADTELTCKNVKTYFEKKGIAQLVNIQEQPNADLGGVCLNRGCCGNSARTALLDRARSQFEAALWSELNKMADLLATRARKFDDAFRKLLQTSKETFHNMFKKTYGIIYEKNSYVFEKLFEELDRYYTAGDADFLKMMEKFFGILYEKMFTVLNSQYTFDNTYLKCVNEHMRDIKPFEDVPMKLTMQLQRAFVASRTFYKALKAGSQVVRSMTKVGVSDECAAAWARMRFCGPCGGGAQPACSRYCHNVAKGCLPTHADLGEQWDAYVDALEKVAERLLGPFSIVMVVEPLDIKISEAIMSFQEHNLEISQKIFAGCGKPELGGSGGATSSFTFTPEKTRPARSVPDFVMDFKDDNDFEIDASFENLPEEQAFQNFGSPEAIRRATAEMAEHAKLREKFLDYMRGTIGLEQLEEHERRRRDAQPDPAGAEIGYKPYEFEGKRGGKKKKTSKEDYGLASEREGPPIDKLVRESRARVRGARNYWSHLHALMCEPVSVTAAPCFNGTLYSAYTELSAEEGSAALASNPEVRGASSDPAAAAARDPQNALRALTTRLKDAFNGHEVHWVETGDLQAVSSASDRQLELFSEGSGSGSGDETDDTEDLPDDDEDRNVYSEGSGRRPDIDESTDLGMPSIPEAEPPIVPSIVDTPNTNNVQIRGRIGDIPAEPELPTSRVEVPPAREQPVAGSNGPSLHKALFTYALPVVCTWFGTIITDLF